jgi:surface polysaccharide O-acyltransferase-like enzyme
MFMTTTKPQNFEWINSLRLIALLAVIILHTASPLLMQYGKVPLNDWLTADAYNSLTRFAVPAFVMITGALLLHREYELGDFLKKRLGRVVVPFLFWSLVYVGYSWYNEELIFNGDTWVNIKQVLHQLKYGSSYHLWYVYMLIGLYFVIPIISRFVRNATNKELRYFLVIWLAVMLLGQPYISRFNPQVDLHYFTGYVGYLVLGHYLTYNIAADKRIVAKMFMLFVAVVAIMIFGTYLLYKYNTGLITLLYEPLGPAVVLLSASVFLMARFSTLRVPAFITKAKSFACRYNFGIYLGHALILYVLEILGINYQLCTPILSIPLTALLCFVLTLLLIWVIDKIPFIGKHIRLIA